MTFKELRQVSGMTQKEFAEYFEIPKRSVENWDAEARKCPEYLLKLMEYKLTKEKEFVYLIYKDSMDDACTIIGYVNTAEEAEKYCDEHNSKVKYEWEQIEWEKIDHITCTQIP